MYTGSTLSACGEDYTSSTGWVHYTHREREKARERERVLLGTTQSKRDNVLTTSQRLRGNLPATGSALSALFQPRAPKQSKQSHDPSHCHGLGHGHGHSHGQGDVPMSSFKFAGDHFSSAEQALRALSNSTHTHTQTHTYTHTSNLWDTDKEVLAEIRRLGGMERGGGYTMRPCGTEASWTPSSLPTFIERGKSRRGVGISQSRNEHENAARQTVTQTCAKSYRSSGKQVWRTARMVAAD